MLRDRDDAGGFIEAFTGSHRFVLDYLVEEVLNSQSQQVRNFLLDTAVLDQVTGPVRRAHRWRRWAQHARGARARQLVSSFPSMIGGRGLCADSSHRALDQLQDLSAAELDDIIGSSLSAQVRSGVTTLRDLGDIDWAVVERRDTGPGQPRVVASGLLVRPPAGCRKRVA